VTKKEHAAPPGTGVWQPMTRNRESLAANCDQMRIDHLKPSTFGPLAALLRSSAMLWGLCSVFVCAPREFRLAP